jgi:hypothetical protein
MSCETTGLQPLDRVSANHGEKLYITDGFSYPEAENMCIGANYMYIHLTK